MKISPLLRTLILLPLLVWNVACTSLNREIEQVDEQTAELTTEVKSALIANESVDAAAILVTRDHEGSLVLSGFVASEAERQAAMAASRTAAPGSKLVDELELR
ncbi:BON domain-containing protein [Granulosicoccus antarcticus]|uniref:BON domain-containing protein n=1 Tax=Granulosicoccus antarcticus IMCC3135 TaxID=1192854 RepID=A0A2Z2NQS3_9GAMM|nr:BON domain-containing protein [Granulosicoccus antarcticus]ASJ73752.1 hypothetical protein IMCC3135_18365 [Granulosicoccus antarcticus IMCC3135]